MSRFDLELLDESDPFEIDDDNRPHLAKHSPYSPEDLDEAWADPDGLFVEAARGPAEWFLVACTNGEDVVQIPLAPSRSGSWRQCRPIGIYKATKAQQDLYEAEDS